MIEVVFTFIQELFEVFVLNRFLRIFFGKYSSGKVLHYSLIFMYWLIAGAVRIIFEYPWLNLITTIAFLSLIVILSYRGTLGRKILVVLLVVSLGMACEDVIWVSVQHNSITTNNDFTGSLMAVFLILLLEILLQRCLKLGKEVSISTIYFIIMMMIPLCSIVITNIIVDGSYNMKYAQLLGISMTVLINIFTFYLYDIISETYEEKWKNAILEKQVSMYENQFEIIRESQNKLKSFRHDMKHHFMMISNYIKNGNEKELSDYIEQGIKYIEVEREFVKSGNEDVDCILNFMLKKANEIGAEMDVKIKVEEEKFMSSMDMNILLSNLLENAIEALKKAECKKLSLYLNMEKRVFYISVYNTYNYVRIKHGEFMSIKRKGQMKGIGLENIHKIVNKYNGKINIQCEGNIFKIDAILFLENRNR